MCDRIVCDTCRVSSLMVVSSTHAAHGEVSLGQEFVEYVLMIHVSSWYGTQKLESGVVNSVMRTHQFPAFILIQTTTKESLLSQSKSKSKVKSQKDLEWLYSAVVPPTTTTHPHKLFSATRHPIELKFSQQTHLTKTK